MRLCKTLSFQVLEEHKGTLATVVTEETVKAFIKHIVLR